MHSLSFFNPMEQMSEYALPCKYQDPLEIYTKTYHPCCPTPSVPLY